MLLERALAAAAAAAAAEDGLESPPELSKVLVVAGKAGLAPPPAVIDPRLLMPCGDRERVRPPRRLVAVVRGPPELLECTDVAEGGRAG